MNLILDYLPSAFLIGSFAGVVSSAVFEYLASHKTSRIISLANSADDEIPAKRDLKAETRYYEVCILLQDQDRHRRLLFRSSTALIASQAVIGGLLTSSIVLKNLSEPVLSGAGLLVLVATLINHSFRLDSRSKISAEKTRKLRALKRWVEDQVYKLEQFNPQDAVAVETREAVTKQLAEIEAYGSEILDYGKVNG
jgi:hypothetical protein